MIECKFEGGKKTTELRHVVMDALIWKKDKAGKDKILLIKRAKDLYTQPGKWATPGGYLDKNETTQQGILREVQEETGFKSEIVSLFRIIDNPKRTGDLGRQNVSLVYFIKAIKKVQKADQESEKVKWMSFNEIKKIKTNLAFDHWQFILKPFIDWQKSGQKPELFC
jgi:8-oxo-dGTP diphosphatase